MTEGGGFPEETAQTSETDAPETSAPVTETGEEDTAVTEETSAPEGTSASEETSVPEDTTISEETPVTEDTVGDTSNADETDMYTEETSAAEETEETDDSGAESGDGVALMALEGVETHTHDGFTPCGTGNMPSTSGSYYLEGDVNGDWVVPENTTINLCLNGFTINGQITVNGSATLNIYDEAAGTGTINSSAMRTIYNEGTVNIYGGNINNGTSDAIFNEYGTVNVYGGNIQDITSHGSIDIRGGYVQLLFGNKDMAEYERTRYDVKGGKIDKIEVNNNLLHLSGNAAIGEISLSRGCLINIDGKLENTFPYKITMDQPDVFTNGANGKASAANFESGMENYVVADGENGELMLQAKPHKHEDGKEFKAWLSGSIYDGSYYAADNVSGECAIYGTVDLCLNGKKVMYDPSIAKGATLNIYDDGEPGENVQFTFGSNLEYEGNQIINIYGGYVGLNGLYTPATINVSGGKLGSEYYTYIYMGTLNIYGGEIAFYNNLDISEGGTLTLSGNPQMGDTTIITSTGNPIKISGPLDADVRCKVQLGESGGAGLFAVLDNETYAAADNFVPSDSKYHVVKNGTKLYLTDQEIQHSHDDGMEFTPWLDTGSLPTTGGYYYLMDDVNIIGCEVPEGEVNLCLNGHTINGTLSLNKATTLNIYDETGEGKIVSSIGIGRNGDDVKTINIYGGTVEGTVTGIATGNSDNNNVNVYGGTLKGGTLFSISIEGDNDDVKISGGTIDGAINLPQGTLTISGDPIITGNAMNSQSAISFAGTSVFNLSGSPTIEGEGDLPGIRAGKGKVININGKLTPQKPIKIALPYQDRDEGTPVVLFAVMGDESYADASAFEAYDEGYTIVKNGKKLYLTKQETHEHDEKVFTPWLDTENLPTESGSYYLTEDMVMSGEWTVPAGAKIDLCLNGNIIRGAEIIVPTDAELNIYDCSKISGESGIDSEIEGSVGITNSGKVNIYGGSITFLKNAIVNEESGILNISYDAGIYAQINGYYNTGIINKGTMTIKNGVIIGSAAAIENSGKLTLENVTVYCSGVSEDPEVSRVTPENAIVNTDTGTLTISGGSIGYDVGEGEETIFSSVYGIDNKGTLNLAGDVKFYTTTANIKTTQPINITGELASAEQYVIDMDTPGVFATGDYAEQSVDKFKSAKELEEQGYSVNITEDGSLELVQHKHGDMIFKAWTKKDSLPDTKGNWYLTGDVEFSDYDGWKVPDGVTNLCLNGHNITNTSGGNAITVNSGTTLNIYDDEGKSGSVNSNDRTIENSGTLTINDTDINCLGNGYAAIYNNGKVTINNSNINSAAGYCLYNNDYYSNGIIEVKGGTIKAKAEDSRAVFTYSGTVRLTDVGIEINGNNGQGIYAYKSDLNLTDISITASGNADHCYGIYVYESKVKISDSDVRLGDGSSNNGIHASNSQVTLTGSDITVGEDEYSSYGINSYNSTVTLSDSHINGGSMGIDCSGGTLDISGNSSVETGTGYGIYFNGDTFNLSGSPEISGAKADIYLYSDKVITIAGAISGKYSVEMARPGVFTSGANANTNPEIINCFESADSNYIVIANEDDELELVKPHYHTIDGKEVNFIAWDKPDSLPDKAGNYYLTENVNLNGQWNVPKGGVNLCLNGKNIECGNNNIWLADGKTLSIYDCQETHGTITSSAGLGTIFINTGDSTVNIYGGTIENTGEPNGVSGGVAVYNCGSLNIYGGNIHCRNYAVYNTDSAVEVTVTGGTISGGEYGIRFDGNTTFNLSGNSEISGAKAGICLTGPINITDKLTGEYTIHMDDPGVFTNGARGRANAENFVPSDDLKAGGYVVAETEDGELVIALKYTIEYRAGSDGTGEVDSTAKIYGVKTTLSEDKFTRSGYTQVGWTTKENGETINTTADGNFDKTDGQYALGDNFTENRDITLYPVWMKNKIVLDHDSFTRQFNIVTTDKNPITIQPSTAEIEITEKDIKWTYKDENGIISEIWINNSDSGEGKQIFINTNDDRAGTATITFSADDGLTTAEYTVTVEKQNSEGIFEFSPEQTTEIGYGENLELKVTTDTVGTKPPPPEKDEEDEEYSLSLMSAELNKVEFYVNDNLVGTATMDGSGAIYNAAFTVQVSHAKGFKSGSNTIRAVYGGSNDRYSGSECTIEVNVTPKTITAKITGEKTKTYDGTTDVPESITIGLDGVLDGDDAKAAGELRFDSADVGLRTITAAGLTIEGDQKDCYALGSTEITDSGTITKKPLEIPAKEYIYDGETSREITINGVNGETVTAALTANSKNAGTYTYSNETGSGNYTVKFKVDGESSNNYDVEKAGELTINKRTAEIKWSDKTLFIYDETEKTVTAAWSNKVKDDDAELKFTDNKKIEVGDYTATVEIIGADSINYTLDGVKTEQSWEITTANSGLTLTAEKQTVTYGDTVSLKATVKRTETNGIMLMSAAQDNVDFYIGDDLIGTGKVKYTGGSNGTADLELPATSEHYFKAGENTIRAEYGGSSNLSGSRAEITITVNKKPVTADIVGITSKVYDGTNTITGLSLQLDEIEDCDKENVEAAAKSYTFNSANVIEANTITANGAALSGTQAGNYELTVKTIIGTITPAQVTIPDSEFTYDGETVRKIEIKGVNSETVTAALTANSKNAGTYTYNAEENGYTAALDNSNYEIGSAGTLTIEPLTAELEWSETEFNYDENQKTVTADVTNAVDGDTFNIKYTGNTAKDVGGYTAEVTDLGNDNYQLDENTSVDWSIKESALKIDTPPTASAITYGQSLSESEITGGVVKNGEITVSGKYEWENGAEKPAVSDSKSTGYTVKFIPDDENYSGIAAEITLKVNKKALTPTVSAVNSKTYDGTTAAEGSIGLFTAVNGEEPTAAGTFKFTDKNAGKNKSVKVSGIALDGNWNDNYTLSVTSLDGVQTTAEILPLTAEIEWQEETSFIYDETEKTVTAAWSNKVKDDDAELKFTDNKKIEVGDYTATVTIDGDDKDNYTLDGVKTEQPWKITAADSGLTLTAEKQTVTYGETVSLTATVKRAETGKIMLMSAAQGSVDFYIGDNLIGTGAVEYTDGSNGTASLELSATSAKYFKAGDNTVRAEYGGSHDLSSSSAEITIKVNKKTVTADIVGTSSKVYDGADIITGLSLQLNGIESCDTDDVQATAESYTFNSANVTEANTITANGAALSGTQAGNYELTVETITGTITPASITIPAQTFTYSGEKRFTSTIDTNVNNENIEVTFTTTSKNVGDYSYGEGYSASGENKNYQIIGGESLTIAAKTINSIEWQKETTFQYDEKPHTVTASVNDKIDTDNVKLTYDNNVQTDVGEYTAVITGLEGEDSGNYVLSEPSKNSTLTWHILESAINTAVLPTAGEITYGESLDKSEITGGIVKNGEIEVAGNFKWQDGGIYPKVSDSESTGYTAEFIPADKNYKSITVSLTVKVNKKSLVPSVGEVESKTYNGKTGAIGTISLEGAVLEDEPTATAKFAFTDPNVGTRKFVNVEKIDIGFWSANYELSADSLENQPTNAEINPLPAEFTWSNGTFTYDGTKKTVTAEVKNKVDNDKFTLEYEENTATDKGSYTAKVTALGNANYTLEKAENVEFNWSIGAKSIEKAKISIEQLTYNGTAQTPQVTVTLEGKTLSEGSDYTLSYSDEVKNAGKYTVTAEGTGNYTGSASAEFMVTQKTVTPILNGDVNKVYDGNTTAPVTAQIVLDGVVTGDDVSVSGDLSYDNSNAGTRTLTAENIALSGSQADNYKLSADTLTAAAEIKPLPAVLEWTAAEFTYDGNEHSVNAAVTNLIGSDECAVTAEGNKAVNAGEYQAAAQSLSNANYTLDGAENTTIRWRILLAGNAAPTVTINFVTETLTTDDTMEYSADGENWIPCTAAMSVKAAGWNGSANVSVQFRYKADENHRAGESWNLIIPSRSAAPDISGMTVTKTQNSITVTEIPDGEYSINGKTWQDSGTFEGLTEGTEYTIQIRTKATESAFASFAAKKAVVTSDTSSGTTDLKAGETVETDSGSITNDGKSVEIEDKNGNKTTVTLPEGTSDSVEVDENGNVRVPGGSIVETGDTTVTLPDGGTVKPDGTITADNVVTGETTVSGDNVTVAPNGNITVSGNGTVQNSDTTVTLPEGGTVKPDGTITADKVVTGETTVSGDEVTVTPDGNITVSGNGTVQTGETAVTLPNGGTVKPDGTITADKVVTGDTTVTGDEVTVAPDGNITVSGNGTVQTGETAVTLPEGGTIKPNGTITADKVVTGETTVSGDEVTVTPDGNITVSGNGTVQNNDTTVTLPEGGTVKPDGTITADKVVTGDTTVSGDEVTVTPDGNITVSGNGTVQNGDTTVTLPDGGTVKPDGTITADKVVTGETTVSGDEVMVTPDGNITVSGNGTVQNGDTTVTLPDGGTIKPDGTITADKVVTGDTTVFGDEVTVAPDGNITVSGNGTVQTGETTVTLPEGGTVKPDGTITADKVVRGETTVSGDEVMVTPDGNITVSGNGTVQNGDTTVTLPDGGTVKPDGTITADKVVTGETTVSGDEVTVTPDGNITVSGNGTVQNGDTTVTLPDGGTVKPDGTITADKVVTGETTVSGDEVMVTPDGNITVSGNGTVQTGETAVTLPEGGIVSSTGIITTEKAIVAGTNVSGNALTVTPDGTITLPMGGMVGTADGRDLIVSENATVDLTGVHSMGIVEPEEAGEMSYSGHRYDISLHIENASDEITESKTEELKNMFGAEITNAYDITLLYNHTIEIQPDRTIRVTLVLPKNSKENTNIFRMEKDGSFTDMHAVCNTSAGTISFVTSHLSLYVLAKVTDVPGEPEEPQPPQLPVPKDPVYAEPSRKNGVNVPTIAANGNAEEVGAGAGVASENGEMTENHVIGHPMAILMAMIAMAAAVIIRRKRQK